LVVPELRRSQQLATACYLVPGLYKAETGFI
jgi:hypothetical protein